ncbi:alkaline shock response membrane anchor protein AmaP [Haloactinomyces albus]|uniref:Alkaline shock response membrane anchor protein AmaP n=1 Tax=Haloactinomyces albus TaxID=1352928 RepID=A0AAE4CN92_9ACTN|nr:alkaline shock response membrane anchor protein AmaP [Haloactinomyces albus]MDR7303191.1 hypothetical protein [Haloactinomyces albus]
MTAHQLDRKSDADPSSTPTGRSLGFERGVTAVIGVLALLGGTFALLVGAGLLGIFRAQRTVLDPIAAQWLRTHPRAATAAAIALGLVLLGIGIWWAKRALRFEGRPQLRLGSTPSGSTTVTAAALTEAIRSDVRSIGGVTRFRVRMAGTPRDPSLRLVLSLQQGTDIRRVWEQLDQEVLAKARQTLDTSIVPTAIRLELDRAPRQRVR